MRPPMAAADLHHRRHYIAATEVVAVAAAAAAADDDVATRRRQQQQCVGSRSCGLSHVSILLFSRIRYTVYQTFLQFLQVILGFLVMGIMLRYSGWIAVTVLLLSGVGHYLIGVVVFRKPLPTLPTSLEHSRDWFAKLIKEHQELTSKIS